MKDDNAIICLAASALQDAGFKQALIFVTRLGRADGTKKIDKSDPKELEKYGLRVFQAMDTVTMLEGLIKKTTKPRAYTLKINHVIASINLALRVTLLN